MPTLTMAAHRRVGVLRCDGCWSAAPLDLPTTPSALSEAQRWVARVLPTWGISVEHSHAVQRVTCSLLQPALAQERATRVAVTLVRHADGIIVEACEALPFSPGATMLLSLPEPSGLHWCHDAHGDLWGRLLWCGVPTPPHPTQRAPSAGTSPSGRGGYRPRLG